MTNYNLAEKLESSLEILQQAQAMDPHTTVLAFSGGDDSLTTLSVMLELGFVPDYLLHANTLTGFPETLQFVHDTAKMVNIPLLTCYPTIELSDLVERNEGFVGVGGSAHNITFGELKGKPIRNAISVHIRKGKRNRPVQIFSGIRRDESAIRRTSDKYSRPFVKEKAGKKKGVQQYSPNLWVCPILWWSKEDCLEYLEDRKISRNPISVKYGRSGDCHCGSAIANPDKEFKELCKDAPLVAEELSRLNQYCINKKWTTWAEPRNKTKYLESKGQCNMFEGIDLCGSCKNRYVVESQKPKT